MMLNNEQRQLKRLAEKLPLHTFVLCKGRMAQVSSEPFFVGEYSFPRINVLLGEKEYEVSVVDIEKLWSYL